MNRGMLIGALGGAIAGWAYLPVIWAWPGFIVAGAVVGWLMHRKNERTAHREKVRSEFRELLDSLASSYASGGNSIFAFEKALQDLRYAFGDHFVFEKDLIEIVHGVENNIPLERGLLLMQSRIEDENVSNFVDAFVACLRRGGDLQDLVRESRDILIEKQDVEREIEATLASGKRELNILAALPFVVLLTMRFLSGTGALGAIDIIVRLLCIPLFGGAYVLGRRMIEVEI